MEVCQDGIDGVLPAWCVPVDLSMDTRIQLMIEIAILDFFLQGFLLLENGNESGIDKKG